MPDSLPAEYVFGPYRVRTDERVLRIDGRDVALGPKVVDTLIALVAQPDRIVPKAVLMDCIWPDAYVDEANLTQNIYVLRKLFATNGSGVRIDNVPKRGYRLVAPVAAESIAADLVASDWVAAESVAPDSVALASSRALPTPPRRSVYWVASQWLSAVAAVVIVLLGIGGPASNSDLPVAASPYALSADALHDYLLGRYYLNRGTTTDLHRSFTTFSRLVRSMPQSGFGYAGLADSLTSLTFVTGDPVVRAQLSARAIAYATEAVRKDARCADAYAALGAVQATLEHDDAAATRAFESSLQLDPRNFDALVWYGTQAMNGGRVTFARHLFQRAISIDPSSPGPIASLAWADFLDRDFIAAVAFSEQLLRAHQLESIARLTLASAYVEMGDYARALPHVAALRQYRDTQTQSAALLAQVFALKGSASRGLDALTHLEAHTNPDTLGAWDILALAAAYGRLGRDETAFVWLTRIRSSERRQIARDPRFDQLRKDRRFIAWVNG